MGAFFEKKGGNMADLRQLLFSIGFKGDTSPIKKMNTESDKLKQNMNGVDDSFKTATASAAKMSAGLAVAGAAMTAAVTMPIVNAGKAAFQMASDFEENVNKVDVAFKDNAATVMAWSETALESFGLSQNSALEAASLFGDMGTAMGLSTGEAANMSTSLTGLAGDLASFKKRWN